MCINLLDGKKCKVQDAEKNEAPYIQVFLPAKEKATGRAILICPGGGYAMVASKHEGTQWAPFFNEMGIATIVLKYRLPKGDSKIPIQDAETALATIRKHASEWTILPEKIGIMESSAGGHLASTIATHTDTSLRPEFQILFYPVISMDKEITHMGSHDNLLGSNASAEREILFSNEKQIHTDTPPAILLLSADDTVVVPANSIRYFEALRKKNISASMHIYPSGGHGWGFNLNFPYHTTVLEELKQWLSLLP